MSYVSLRYPFVWFRDSRVNRSARFRETFRVTLSRHTWSMYHSRSCAPSAGHMPNYQRYWYSQHPTTRILHSCGKAPASSQIPTYWAPCSILGNTNLRSRSWLRCHNRTGRMETLLNTLPPLWYSTSTPILCAQKSPVATLVYCVQVDFLSALKEALAWSCISSQYFYAST